MGSSDLIFIIGRQRSGTTVFRDLLKRHGARDCDEIFHGDLTHEDRFYRYVLKRVETHPHLVHPEHHAMLFREFIEELRQKSDHRKLAMDVKYFGLNLIPAREDVDGRSPFVLNFIRHSKAHAVHIIRPNKVRIYISEEMAKATGRWSAGRVEHLVSEKPKLNVKVSEALAFIDRLLLQDERVTAMLDPLPNAKRLIYSEMFKPNGHFSEDVVKAATNILDMDDVDPKPGNLKMNPEPVSDLIENFDELSQAMTGSEHEWMLYDDG